MGSSIEPPAYRESDPPTSRPAIPGHAGEGRILGFDGLRAIGFLLVFFSHKLPTARDEFYGEIGVWLFFILSGFLITRILVESREMAERTGFASPGRLLANFYIRRAGRIFPVYYMLLAALTLASVVVPMENFTTHSRIFYWTYLTNFYLAEHGWAGHFSHLWSLAVEEQYYLIFAPLVLFLPRGAAMASCILFILVGILAQIWLATRGADVVALTVNSATGFALFGIGGIAGLLANRRMPAWSVASWLSLAVLACYLLLPLAVEEHRTWLIWGRLSCVLVALLLVQIAQNQTGLFTRCLEIAPLRSLGIISYGAYLFHNFIHLDVIERAAMDLGVQAGPSAALRVLAELALTIVLSAMSWRWFEKPIRNWARAASAVTGIPARGTSRLAVD